MEELEEKKEVETVHPPPKKKKRILLVALLLVGAALLGLYLWNLSRMDDTSKYWFDKMAKDGTLQGKSPSELQEMLDKIVAEGMFNVSINVAPVFLNGKAKGTLGIENVKENRYFCRVVLTKDDDGTVLYESAGLKPGQYIDEITLSKDLPRGEYPCTATFIATNPETLDELGRINVKLKVTVQN
ncbi:MAG: hypothetical protein ACRCU3_10535 [Eubacteriaceae bacterium]